MPTNKGKNILKCLDKWLDVSRIAAIGELSSDWDGPYFLVWVDMLDKPWLFQHHPDEELKSAHATLLKAWLNG